MLKSRPKKIPSQESQSDTQIDAHIGARLRKLRALLGMTQEQLGRSLGITFQQIQKYEHGTNRISASRLFMIATLLDVSVAYFFEDLTTVNPSDCPVALSRVVRLPRKTATQDEGDFDVHSPEHREMLEFARSYNRISNLKIRRKVYELMRAVVGEDE